MKESVVVQADGDIKANESERWMRYLGGGQCEKYGDLLFTRLSLGLLRCLLLAAGKINVPINFNDSRERKMFFKRCSKLKCKKSGQIPH